MLDDGIVAPLSEEDASYVRSGVCIAGLFEAVDHLVWNALEAGASSIAVTISRADPLSLTVADNGSGLTEDNLKLIGHRHHTGTSARNLPGTHKGEALASLILCSAKVCIVSKVVERYEGFSVGFEAGVRTTLGEAQRQCAGTTVSVEGLFAAFPVRQRLFAKMVFSKRARLLERLMTQIAIAFRSEVTLRLVEKDSGDVLFQKRPEPDIGIIPCIRFLFGEAFALKMTSACKTVTPTSTTVVQNAFHFSLNIAVSEGNICTTRDTLQVFTLNRRPVQCVLVDSLVAKIYSRARKVSTRGGFSRDFATQGHLYPAYVIELTLPGNAEVLYDITPSGLGCVAVLRADLFNVVAHELFLMLSVALQGCGIATPGCLGLFHGQWLSIADHLLSTASPPPPTQSEDANPEHTPSLTDLRSSLQLEEGCTVEKEDPLRSVNSKETKESLSLFGQSRLGRALRANNASKKSSDKAPREILEPSSPADPPATVPHRAVAVPEALPPPPPQQTKEVPQEAPPAALPTLPTEGKAGGTPTVSLLELFQQKQGTKRKAEVIEEPQPKRPCCVKSMVPNIKRRWWDKQVVRAANAHQSVDTAVIDRKDFAGLKVIGQAYKQFIFCENSAGLLLGIDQHAADERIKLETLRRSLHTLVTTNAARTTLAVSPHEVSLIAEVAPALERWGWVIHQAAQGEVVVSVPVVSFPEWVAEPRVWKLPGASISQAAVEVYEGGAAVTPSVFTRLLASKACRSAVMFGDPLTHAQCVSLVQRLSQTNDPFHCAHGRPAVVPLCQPAFRPAVLQAPRLGRLGLINKTPGKRPTLSKLSGQ